MSKGLAVVGGREMSPTEMVKSLSPQDKATIMSLCMPKGATDSDLALYLYRCKEMGFDPLSGELVLQKYFGKEGPRLSFITTRDALLRKAAENPDYMGMNSGVVREGDTFQVDTEKGIVKHTFGAKRGRILAGWAVVYHKSRLPIIATADFLEYAAANNSPVWKSMPSAMIQKVAEVAALRRQFPVGVQVYTAEEMILQEEQPTPLKLIEPEEKQPSKLPKGEQRESQEQPQQNTVDMSQTEPQIPAYKLIDFQTGKSGSGTPVGKIMAVIEGQEVLLLAKGEDGLAEAAKLSEGCIFKAETFEESGFQFIRSIKIIQEDVQESNNEEVQQNNAQDTKISEEPAAPPDTPAGAYKLMELQTGKTGTGTPVGKIKAEKDGQEVLLLIKGDEGFAETAKLRENCSFYAETFDESGFTFIRSITIV